MKADWHLDVPVDDFDPFADPPEADVRQGERVDLSSPDALRARLVALMLREGQLYDRGITCPIKDRPDSCCSACPLSGHARTQRIRKLCRVGKEQEATVMTILGVDA